MNDFNSAVKTMLGISNATPSGAMAGIFTDLVISVLSNPEAVEGLQQLVCPHHNAIDVAQDALDAYEHGKLSKSQALRIINIALEEEGVTVDVEKREVLENLFKR